MQHFSWQYFSKTGDVQAYLLYKLASQTAGQEDDAEQNDSSQEELNDTLS